MSNSIQVKFKNKLSSFITIELTYYTSAVILMKSTNAHASCSVLKSGLIKTLWRLNHVHELIGTKLFHRDIHEALVKVLNIKEKLHTFKTAKEFHKLSYEDAVLHLGLEREGSGEVDNIRSYTGQEEQAQRSVYLWLVVL